MVYCSKCGTPNPDDANVCSKCGAPLQPTGQQRGPYWRHRYREGEYYHHGEPGIGILIFGAIIILIGLNVLLEQVYGFNFPWWPIILIIVGLWLIFVAFRRRRWYSARQPH